MRASSKTGGRLSHLARRVGGAQSFVFTLFTASAAVSTGVGLFHRPVMFLALGLMALLAVIWPLRRMTQGWELLSPWSLIVASVLVGVTVRSAYLALGLVDAKRLDGLLLLGEPVDVFILPGALLVVALLLAASSFFSVRASKVKPARIVAQLSRRKVQPRALRCVALLSGILAILAFIEFARQTGGLDLLEPSRKRAVPPGLDPGTDYRGLGYLRFVASFAGTAYLALLAYYSSRRGRIGGGGWTLLAFVFVSACLLPFYASSRSEILWLLILSGAILAFSGRGLRPRNFAIGVAIALLLFNVMTVLRAEKDVEEVFAEPKRESQFVEGLILNRNLVDITRTAHVINAVPETLDYKYGRTIWIWALAPIPRELWPEKPVIQAGPEIGVLVYGTKRAGVLPGFVGEMYWNFHWPGVILGSLLFGFGLRWVQEKLHPRGSRHPGLILVYVVVVIPLGMSVLGGTLGLAIFNALMDAVEIWMILSLCTSRSGAKCGGGIRDGSVEMGQGSSGW